MKHLNLKFNSKKEGKKLHRKIILCSRVFIISPLNQIFEFLHKKNIPFLINGKPAFLFSECWFSFLWNRLQPQVKGII